MDELSPLFQEIEFHERFRGYDPDEVDAYVDRVARAAALAQGRLAELHERVEATEALLAEGGGGETEDLLRRTLVLAQRTADAAVAEAQEEAARLIADAEAKSQSTITLADSRAEAQLADAEERSSRVIAEIEADRRGMVADAEAAAAAAGKSVRERLGSEVDDLARTRDFLQDDIEILERHLREQRARLASSVATLSDLLEAPDALRVEPAPATSGVEHGSSASTVAATPVEGEETPVEEAALDETADETSADETSVDETSVDETSAGETSADETDAAETAGETSADETAAAETAGDETDAAETAADSESIGDDLYDELIDADEEVIDLLAEERAGETETGRVGDPGDVDAPFVTDGGDPSPPRLVTAADLDTESQMAGTTVDAGPATMPVPVMEETSLFGDADPVGDDPFLAQLRNAVASDDQPTDDDALSAFFDQDDDEAGRSWFGRRR